MTHTIATLLAAHAAGKPLTATIEETYDRIARHGDPALVHNAAAEGRGAGDRRALQASGPAGKPLFGVPFAVKDNIDVAGLPTTAACPAFAYRPQSSAFVVERLERAGAIVVGKTNLDQFATGLVGVRSPYGVPRNALRARPHPRRLELRLGDRGRRRARRLSRSAPTRPARAACRRRSTASSD